jgi:hypothetical protein
MSAGVTYSRADDDQKQAVPQRFGHAIVALLLKINTFIALIFKPLGMKNQV